MPFSSVSDPWSWSKGGGVVTGDNETDLDTFLDAVNCRADVRRDGYETGGTGMDCADDGVLDAAKVLAIATEVRLARIERLLAQAIANVGTVRTNDLEMLIREARKP